MRHRWFVALGMGLASLIFFFSSIEVSAATPIGENGPKFGQSTVSDSEQRPHYAVGNGAFDGKRSWVKIYVPLDQSTTVTIDQACGLDVGSPTVFYQMIDLGDGKNEPTEEVTRRLGGTYDETKSGGSSCLETVTFPQIKASDGIPSQVVGHEGWRVFLLVARINDATGDNERSFVIKSSNESSYVGASRKINTAIIGSTYNNGFGVYQRNAPSLGAETWAYEIEFAPTCSELDANDTRTIRFYDLDQGVYSPQNLGMEIRRANRASNPSYSDPWRDKNNFNSGTDQRDNFSFTANNKYIYKLYIRGMNYRNTIQVQIPFDQIDALPTVPKDGTPCGGEPQQPPPPTRVCSIGIQSAGPASVDGSLRANSPLSITMTVGAGATPSLLPDGMPATITNTSGTVYQLRAYAYIEDSGGTYLSGRVVDLPGISENGQTTAPLDLGTAPNTRDHYSIYAKVFYQVKDNTAGAGYNGSQYDGDPFDDFRDPIMTCNKDVSTWQEFNTSASANLALDDAENPTSVVATGSINRNEAQTDAPITNANLKITRNGNLVPGTNSDRSGAPWQWAGTVSVGGASDPSKSQYVVPNGVRLVGWQAGDRVCAVLDYAFKSGWIGPGNNVADGVGSGPISSCDTVTNKPYVSVFGADVGAGGGWCGGSGGSGSISANTKRGGSGTQLGAYATGSIGGFKSLFLKGAGDPASSNKLTFGNSPPNNGGYGLVDCNADFYTNDQYPDGSSMKTNSIDSSLSVTDLADNNQTVVTPTGGTLTLNGGDFNGQHSVFVDGNVYIASNIFYGDTDWANIDEIPFFNLVVKGNIYIAPGVTQLDGRYIAQPKADGSGGEIYTCAPGGSAPAIPGGTLWSSCQTKLTINGQFLAKTIRFLRTANTISDGTFRETAGNAKAGEVFNFSPEMYLARPAVQPKSGPGTGTYQSILTMPPIL